MAQLNTGRRRASNGRKPTIRWRMALGLSPKVAQHDLGVPFSQPKFSIASPIGRISQLSSR
jgi:hypothetical protein